MGGSLHKHPIESSGVSDPYVGFETKSKKARNVCDHSESIRLGSLNCSERAGSQQ